MFNLKIANTLALVIFSSTLLYAKNINKNDLILFPESLETTVDQEHEFNVTGGRAPYKFKTSSGLIRYTNNRAIYISPNFNGESTVTVFDASGLSKTVKIMVKSSEKELFE